ncbi:MAG: extracellular solute-binding protein [Oscillochloris sp.]|nr:extracellular solute-binding protein [Oscillochloris sp.]
MRRVVIVALVLLLTACASGLATTATPSSQPAAANDRTLVVLWHAWPALEQQTLNSLVEQYNRLNPTTQVVIQSRPATTIVADIRAAVAEGGGPHMAIVPSHTLGILAEQGWIQPLEDLFASGDLSRLLPAAVGSAQIRDGAGEALYGIPITFDTLGLYYNRANFASEPPADITALLEAARALTDTRSEPPIWGLAYHLNLERTIGYLYAFDGEVFDSEGELTLGLNGRTGAERWLTWLSAMYRDERILAGLDGITVDSALMTGNALMTIDWAHRIENYRALWPEQMGVTTLPLLVAEDRAPQPYVRSDVLVMNARIGAGNERAAIADFARYMIDQSAQQALLQAARQPVLLSVNLDDETVAPADLRAAAAAFRLQGEQGRPMPNNRMGNEIVRAVLSEMQSNVMRGLLSPEQAVVEADATLRTRLGLPVSEP